MTSPCPHKTQTPYTWNFTLRTCHEHHHQGGKVNLPLPPDRPLLYPERSSSSRTSLFIVHSPSKHFQSTRDCARTCIPQFSHTAELPAVHRTPSQLRAPHSSQPSAGESSLRGAPRVCWAKLEKKLSWGSDQSLGLNLCVAGPEIQVFRGSERGFCGWKMPHRQLWF